MSKGYTLERTGIVEHDLLAQAITDRSLDGVKSTLARIPDLSKCVYIINDHYEATPFLLAIRQLQIGRTTFEVDFSIVKLLIEHGADVNVYNGVLERANVLQLCLAKYTYISHDSLVAIEKEQSYTLIRYLLRHGFDLNKNNSGERYLRCAIEHNDDYLLKLFLAHGARVTVSLLKKRMVKDRLLLLLQHYTFDEPLIDFLRHKMQSLSTTKDYHYDTDLLHVNAKRIMKSSCGTCSESLGIFRRHFNIIIRLYHASPADEYYTESGDSHGIKHYPPSKSNRNVRRNYSMNNLTAAVLNGYVGIVKRYLFSSELSDEERVKMLNRPINLQGSIHPSLVHLAIRNNVSFHIIELLVNRGSRFDRVDSTGKTVYDLVREKVEYRYDVEFQQFLRQRRFFELRTEMSSRVSWLPLDVVTYILSFVDE